MASFTKEAIKQTFVKLLNEKPYSQITVKDIVAECGINRNSFYYHFEDLPALVEEIIADEIEKNMVNPTSISSLQEGLGAVLSFVRANKKAVYHLYNSVNRDVFERYLMKTCDEVISDYVDQLFQEDPISPRDRRLVVNYFKYLCFGTAIDWLESGMTLDIEGDFARICELLVDPAIQKSGLSDRIITTEIK